MFYSLLAVVLIAMNMHYAKFTLWTLELQIPAKTLHCIRRLPDLT